MTFESVKQTPNCSGTAYDAIGIVFSVMLTALGIIIFETELDDEIQIRSLTFGFIGLNVGAAWLFFVLEPAKRLDYGLLAFLLPAYAGGLIPVVV